MKVFIDENEYDLIESALIQFGRLDLADEDKVTLTKIMRKLRTAHSLSPISKISVEPVK